MQILWIIIWWIGLLPFDSGVLFNYVNVSMPAKSEIIDFVNLIVAHNSLAFLCVDSVVFFCRNRARHLCVCFRLVEKTYFRPIIILLFILHKWQWIGWFCLCTFDPLVWWVRMVFRRIELLLDCIITTPDRHAFTTIHKLIIGSKALAA